MRLWTIQGEKVYDEILHLGTYRCIPELSSNASDFRDAYQWIAGKMAGKVGPAPDGVVYPVWAWYRRDWRHKKPDLRESGYAMRGEQCVLFELEFPDSKVLLSDFDAWHFVLNHWYLNQKCNDEEAFDREQEWLDDLPESDREPVIVKSWNHIFDIEPFSNGYMERGAVRAGDVLGDQEGTDPEGLQYFTAR